MADENGDNSFDFGPPPEDPYDDYGPDGNRTGEQFPPPSEPMRVARQLEPEWRHDGLLTRRHWRGQWMQWQQTHWVEVDVKGIRSTLYERLEHAYYMVMKDGKPVAKPWAPTKSKMADLLEASSAVTHLSTDTDPPEWVSDRARDGQIVACTNGLLHLATRELLALTPAFYNLVSVPFAYDPHAPEPKAWLEFLDQLWPDDPESISALQEWCGYVVSGRTDQQKILLVVGPTRSGKGTIARVLRELIGPSNLTGPTLASLGTNFGLSPLLGKPLAVISDARLGTKDAHLVTERLLTISGEDAVTVDRKYREAWTGRMPTRLVIMTNEIPAFGDSSGVIAHRMITLMLTRSWLGKEDTELTEKLTAELPGVLNWALGGLDRLVTKGHFTEPRSSAEAVVLMKDQASPMSAFIRDTCTVGVGLEVEVEELWRRWRSWSIDNGREKDIGSKQLFGRNLRSVVPGVKVVQPRDGEQRHRVYQGIAVSSGTQPPWRNEDPFAASARNGHDSDEDVARDGTRENPYVALGQEYLSRDAPASKTTPTMARIAGHRVPSVPPSGSCSDTTHSPRFRGGQWECPECNPEPSADNSVGGAPNP